MLREGEVELLGAPRRVGESRLDVGLFKVRVELDDLREGVAGRNKTDDGADRDAETTNTGLAAHEFGVEGDPAEVFHGARSIALERGCAA